VQTQLQAHPTRLRPVLLLKHGTYSAKSYPHLPVKITKNIENRVGLIDRRLPPPCQISVVGNHGSTQANVTAQAQAFFFRSLLCHILIRSFIVLPARTSRIRVLLLAQMANGPPPSTSSLPCRSLAISSVPVIPSTLSILRQSHSLIPRFSAAFTPHAEYPVSVRCLLRKTRSVPFRLLLSSFFTPSP
jgi:hypothetical protein